jgi:hypothetical protein
MLPRPPIALQLHPQGCVCLLPSPPPHPPPPQKLYFCEYSLHFFKRRSQLLRHLQKCPLRHPPGDEIYRNDGVSMFEVGGAGGWGGCAHLKSAAEGRAGAGWLAGWLAGCSSRI